jgi:peptidylprolyl isomerase domain and WD repeat-containing protein 1
VVTPRTDFFVTGSLDGHLKFWKKKAEGVEFVKHYRSHPGAIVDLSASHDGEYLCTCGAERTVKVYDVVAFDMMGMLKLAFSPGCCAWIYGRGEPVLRLAVADAGSCSVHVFDARDVGGSGAGAAQPLASLASLHGAPVRVMRFNAAFGAVISCDAKGVLEVWDSATYGAAASVRFKFKADTDLYAHARARTVPGSLELSPDGQQFATFSPDRRLRVFRFATGKLRCVIDESLEAAAEAQRAGPPGSRLDDIDYGRRMAVERELDREWATAGGGTAPLPNGVFDESGNFLVFATHLGLKVVNLVTGRVAAVLGRVENNERLLRLALFQGVPGRDKRSRAATANDDAASRARAAGGVMPTGALQPDPTIAACAFRKHRVYLFSRREPSDGEGAATGRDVFNERPQADDLAAAHALASAGATSLSGSATIHTSLGDISVKLYPAECPRTVENWTQHARDGYYDGILFHRVIKGFMLQTGDPLGDGTGGMSIWGGEFDDEIRRDLRHDRPYTLSMANAGPGTNGSQFFITTVACPWLDGKHTVYGRVTKGADVVHAIERLKCDRNDKPLEDVKMLNITLE